MTDGISSISPQLLQNMLEAGVHFGHQAKRWDPHVKPFIWQSRDGIHIFDLLKTAQSLQIAGEAVKQHIIDGKNILFLATKRQASGLVRDEAIRAGMPYIVSRWPGGMLSNWEQINKSIKRMHYIESGLESGEFKHYTKKERVILDRELTRLKRLFVGVGDLKNPPDALFVVDITREKSAMREAMAKKLPIYALIDSNANPNLVDFPIPGNDDAVRSISLLTKLFVDYIVEAKGIAEKSK
ncbi:30S ribosomal protein S2 [Candidatus Beckwithbacteria bacterium CG23_combo_of_CG06-09_8_20_14_all_34_8]|uniref:Small ribosomal subunit protein uS2 n=1 Tax=Candidatus Beckwithbacteria bacterium CG23_combo_of_CG06-09_8_20_14_all_34_8 TaxID=1974497 RepID=A0A2H0B5A1_9BACT|nr:MAG: 30S ribosomal protein S2 [Candidatus Beckwithbacteria bacterium CG23_combo_of_CG06-09_8_20_14_all_34_8]